MIENRVHVARDKLGRLTPHDHLGALTPGRLMGAALGRLMGASAALTPGRLIAEVDSWQCTVEGLLQQPKGEQRTSKSQKTNQIDCGPVRCFARPLLGLLIGSAESNEQHCINLRDCRVAS